MYITTNNNTIIQQMQNSLYQLAKTDIQRFPDLYDKVYQPYILKEAWKRLKKIKSAGRIDDGTLQKVEAYGIESLLRELHTDLQFEAYRIKPAKQETIDRDLIAVKNSIVQMAAKIIIYPIFKADIATNSDVFQTKREAEIALEELCKSRNYKEYYIIEAHIKSCFDSINQDKLMKLVEQRISDHEMLYLIRQWVSSGMMYQESDGISHFGIVKDLVISPLLMSIYLNALDKSWKKHQTTYGKWVRYADEITILCDNKKSAIQALELLQTLLESLDLELDNTNTKVVCNRYINETYDLLQTNQNPIADEPDSESDDETTEPSPEIEEVMLAEEVMPTEEVMLTEKMTDLSADSFCGYKYRFGLYAAHSNVNNSDANIHFHTFTLTLYIHAGDSIDNNYNIERVIKNWLVPYQGAQLSKTDLFNKKETTIEGIGDTLIDPLYELVHQQGYELVKLSIYENPIRVYSVSYKRLDSTVNEIRSISLDCIPIIDIADINENPEAINIEEAAYEVEANAKEAQKEAQKLPTKVSDTDTLINSYEQTVDDDYLKEVALALVEEEEASISAASYHNQTTKMQNIFLVFLKCFLGLGCFIALAMITMYIVKDSGRYPQGSDTFCHLYRADLLLKNMKQGNWFPLYDGTWYNGVEIMRYWGPLPLYIMAGLEYIIHSGILDAYVLLLGVLLVIGGCGWLLWGITYRRIGLSVVIGLLWFFMPENIRVVILEGNLPRGVINALLPFYFFFLWRVLDEKKKNAIFPLIIITALITLCHLGITLMLIVTTVIFILFHASTNHMMRSSLCALGASLSGVLLAGLWVVPALIGGAASGSSTNQVMKFFFESAFVSLNPFNRMNGDTLSFYFGFSIFFICILGMLFGPKKSKAGFITAIVLLICTTKSVYELFVKLPFSQYLWMIRFIPIGLAAAMVSFLLWDKLKKWAVLLLVILLVADCATSYQYIYSPPEYKISDVQANLDKRADEALITDAKEITNQRMALMDLSEYGSFAPYYITGVGETVNYSYGAGWEGAGTASNIVNLNASVENGWYVYLFDRALELGNDTVLIPIDNLKLKSKDLEKLIEAAKVTGYYLVENDGTSVLFHKDTVKQFGVISKYQDLAIGESASGIAMIFPCFEEGSKINLNEYTYEELCNYRTIYLSGFTYEDKTAAEELLLKLAENGVNIYIDMNRVPMDEVKKSMEMFDVTAQIISFTDTFPEFLYQGITYRSLDFSSTFGDWNTVYLIGLDQVDGSCDMTDKQLPYLGIAKNKNLHFIGLNLMYYLQTTRDSEVRKLAEAIFGMKEISVPEREVVPINIQNSNNQITIVSEFDHVNTTLSYIDIFHSDQNITTNNNLITVNSGTTIINMSYPHTEKGIIVTVVGLFLAILTYAAMRKRKERGNHEESN